MIVVDKVKKTFKGSAVLDGASLEVKPGEIAALIGASGSGKTTLGRCIIGLDTVDAGVVNVGGTQLDSTVLPWSDVAIEARQKVGMVFQDLRLWPYRTALDNILEGLIHVKRLSRTRALPLVDEWADLLDITSLLHKYPADLSGGEKQRVAISRAAVMDPEYLILDEITAALDPEIAGNVSDLLLQLRDTGMGLLVISHQTEWVRRCADSVHFILRGTIAESGSPTEVMRNPMTPELRTFLEAVMHGR